MRKQILFFLLFCSLAATAQTFPFVDGFQSYSNFTTLGSQGGYLSDMSVYQTHGMGNSDKGLLSQMNNFNTKDSTITPLIGPVTTSTQLSFFYRIMNPAPQYPFVPATLGSGDVVEIYFGLQSLSIYQLAYTINSTNNIADTSFKKIKIAVPSNFAGQAGNVKIVVRHPTNGNDYNVDIDSLVIQDTIAVAAPLLVTVSSVDVRCHGLCDGIALAAATGGTGPYTFQWSDTTLTGSGRTNLCAATYTVTATDGLSATATASFTITEPDALVLTDSIINVTCAGGNNGCVYLTVTGGVPTYSYVWNSGANTQDNCAIVAGIHLVTVTDANNCTITLSATVAEPPALTFTTSFTNPSTINSTDGTIQIVASGGTPGYFFSIDSGTTFTDSSTFVGLGEDCYYVFVKDTNACTAGLDTVCLTDPATGIGSLNNEAFSIYPNPAADYVVIERSNAVDAELSLMNILGELIWKRTVTGTLIHVNLLDLAEGNYVMLLKTAGGYQRKLIDLVR